MDFRDIPDQEAAPVISTTQEYVQDKVQLIVSRHTKVVVLYSCLGIVFVKRML